MKIRFVIAVGNCIGHVGSRHFSRPREHLLAVPGGRRLR